MMMNHTYEISVLDSRIDHSNSARYFGDTNTAIWKTATQLSKSFMHNFQMIPTLFSVHFFQFNFIWCLNHHQSSSAFCHACVFFLLSGVLLLLWPKIDSTLTECSCTIEWSYTTCISSIFSAMIKYATHFIDSLGVGFRCSILAVNEQFSTENPFYCTLFEIWLKNTIEKWQQFGHDAILCATKITMIFHFHCTSFGTHNFRVLPSEPMPYHLCTFV